MKISDKITQLRKQKGWSQEELANHLHVTRQAVSKWESGQSLPDTDKIILLSQLFQVTTDYLLLDDQGVNSEHEPVDRYLTLEDTKHYLSLKKKAAPLIALGTSLCIISSVLLIGLTSLCQYQSLNISETFAVGVGLSFLILCIAIAVILFLNTSYKVKAYQYLETETFVCEHGVIEYVKDEKNKFSSYYHLCNTIGTALCILSSLGIFASMIISSDDYIVVLGVCVVLIVVSIGVFAFVYAGTIHNAFDRILEEGDYTRRRKEKKSLKGMISVVYWLVVTAIYLFYTFGPYGNGQGQYSWFIWPIAGVLFGVLMIVFDYIIKQDNKNTFR